MKVFSYFAGVFLIAGLIFSCKPSKICPAYHSYFILDRDVTRTTFSLFGADSLPRDPKNDLWQIEKKKVGIADDFAYKKKVRKQAIISMESIYLQQEDPLEMQFAMAEMDSSMIDSLRHVRSSAQQKDFYNYDQIIYLHYFGKYLPKPKPESEAAEAEEDAMITDDENVEQEEEKGFFKRLFGGKKDKKKRKTEEEVVTDEDEYVDDFYEGWE